jgi:hypothetical protein
LGYNFFTLGSVFEAPGVSAFSSMGGFWYSRTLAIPAAQTGGSYSGVALH